MANHIQAHIAFLRSELITNFTPQGKNQEDYPLTLEDQNVWIIGFAGKAAGGRLQCPQWEIIPQVNCIYTIFGMIRKRQDLLKT
ncbi:hypothetical protein [Mongoliitalea lutea]|uniref:hypothetical protein n=1 Tax=Mongoliitalea lutea TaxID=849756 RepID=UPI001676EC96|nr:hypothetical protein [Mongoliitalea lutea]